MIKKLQIFCWLVAIGDHFIITVGGLSGDLIITPQGTIINHPYPHHCRAHVGSRGLHRAVKPHYPFVKFTRDLTLYVRANASKASGFCIPILWIKIGDSETIRSGLRNSSYKREINCHLVLARIAWMWPRWYIRKNAKRVLGSRVS